MRDSDACKLNLAKVITGLPTIKGFGNSSIAPKYKSSITMQLDEIETNVEVLVVNDEFMQFPLLIGQDVTELPFVTVMKDRSRLLFYKCPSTELSTLV